MQEVVAKRLVQCSSHGEKFSLLHGVTQFRRSMCKYQDQIKGTRKIRKKSIYRSERKWSRQRNEMGTFSLALHSLYGKTSLRQSLGCFLLSTFFFCLQRLCYIDKGISGFAIDWVNQDIFWANRQKATIEATDMNGKKRRVLLRGAGRPTRITIDAEQR